MQAMAYGILTCVDSFLFTLVVLPLRALVALLAFIRRRVDHRRYRPSMHSLAILPC